MEDYKVNVLHEEDESSKADFRRQEALEKKLAKQKFNAEKKKVTLEEVKTLEEKYSKKVKNPVIPKPSPALPNQKYLYPIKLLPKKAFRKIDEDINSNHIYMLERARLMELEERKGNQQCENVNTKKKEKVMKEYKKSSGKKEKLSSWKEYLQKDCFKIPKKVQEGYVISNRPGAKNEDLKHSISYRAFAIIS